MALTVDGTSESDEEELDDSVSETESDSDDEEEDNKSSMMGGEAVLAVLLFPLIADELVDRVEGRTVADNILEEGADGPWFLFFLVVLPVGLLIVFEDLFDNNVISPSSDSEDDFIRVLDFLDKYDDGIKS